MHFREPRWLGLVVFLFACALLWSTHAALAADPPVVAVLDMERILRDSKAAKTLRAEIEKERSAHQTELRKQETALRAADEELALQRAVLSAEAFAAKRKELQEQAESLQRDYLSRQRQMEEVFGQGISQVRKALISVATEIAKENDIDLILLKATVVLVIRELDITEEALARLDEKLPEVTVPTEQN